MSISATYHKNFITIILPIIPPHLLPLASGRVEALHRPPSCVVAHLLSRPAITETTNDVDGVAKSDSCSSKPWLILENDDIKA